MYFRSAVVTLLALAVPASAFMGNTAFSRTSVSVKSSVETPVPDASLQGQTDRLVNYKPGEADTDFARKFKHLAGAKVKTVGEAFAEFSKDLGLTINPLYKNMVTDIVGTTHLIVVSARFQRDPIWSLGMISALDLLLKNYPEPEYYGKIVSSLFKCCGLDEAEVRAEAKTIMDWSEGKTKAEIEAALKGEGDSPVATVTKTIKAEKYWMYSRYFGIGLIKLMEQSGMEMDKDEVYPVIDNWMTEKLDRSSLTACNDSDMYFKIKNKLDMMETMMKEIEIREKKRMAERLEGKAEQALRAADREELMQAEISAEAKATRDRVNAAP